MSKSLPRWANRKISMLQYEINQRQEQIDDIVNDRDLPPDHMCGLMGFNPMLGDNCPACDWYEQHRVKS